MQSNELLAYIRDQSARGVTEDAIRGALEKSGWQAADIANGFTGGEALAASATAAAATTATGTTIGTLLSLKLVGVLFGVALVVGGSATAYVKYFRAPKPEVVIQTMLEKLQNITSTAFSGTFSSSGTNREGKPETIAVNFSGISDTWSAIENTKTSLTLNTTVDADLVKFSGGIDLKMIDGTFYLQARGLPNIGFVNLQPLNDQWLKIPKETQELVKKTATPLISKETNALEQTTQTPTPEQTTKLKELWRKSNILRATATLPDEILEGVATFHYRWTLDREALKKLIADTQTIVGAQTLNEKMLTDFNRELDKLPAMPEGELWIGKKDFLPYKFTATMQSQQDGSRATLSFTETLKDFNKPVTVVAPADAKDIMEVIGPLLGSVYQGIVPPLANVAAEANKDSDGDGLLDGAEKLYGSDPNNPDTDNDGHSDAEEVNNGYNPVGEGKLETPQTPASPVQGIPKNLDSLRKFLPTAPSGWTATDFSPEPNSVGYLYADQSGAHPFVAVTLEDYQGRENDLKDISLAISAFGQKALRGIIEKEGLANGRREEPIKGHPIVSFVNKRDKEDTDSLILITTTADRFSVTVSGIGAKREKDLAILRKFANLIDFDGLAKLK